MSEKDAQLEQMRSEMAGWTVKMTTLQEDLDGQRRKNDVGDPSFLLNHSPFLRGAVALGGVVVF